MVRHRNLQKTEGTCNYQNNNVNVNPKSGETSTSGGTGKSSKRREARVGRGGSGGSNGRRGGGGPFKIILIVAVAGILAILLFSLGLSWYSYYLDHYSPKPISQQLQELSELLERYTTLAESVSTDSELIADPGMELLTNRLRPIQDRVSSLSTQTRQHEAMLEAIKVPGGPTNFIDTTLKELHHYLEEDIPKMGIEIDIILLETFNRLSESRKRLSDLLKKYGQWNGLTTSDRTEVLSEEGIIFYPREWADKFKQLEAGLEEEDQDQGSTEEEMINQEFGTMKEAVEIAKLTTEKLANLAILFRAREKIRTMIIDFVRNQGLEYEAAKLQMDYKGMLGRLYSHPEEYGFQDPYPELGLNERIDEAIAKEIETNKRFYEFVIPLSIQLPKACGVWEKKAFDKVVSKLPYARLQSAVIENILGLIKRVERLKKIK